MGFPLYGAGSDQPNDFVSIPACSLNVHREGANLQFGWHRNYIIEPPSSAAWWQQLMGRTHRNGQREGTVHFDVLAATWPSRRSMEMISPVSST